MKFAIRADASPVIGSGHVMRCLTLARRLCSRSGVQGAGEKASCIFVCRHLTDALAATIRSAGHNVIRLKSENLPSPVSQKMAPGPHDYALWLGTTPDHDAAQTVEALQASGHDDVSVVIVDHYGIGADWERTVGSALGVAVCALDDLVRRHHADWIVDTTFGRDRTDYRDLAPEWCRVMAGADYALLRPEFADQREASLARRDADYAADAPVRHLLVTMGGMDADNATARVLKALTLCDMGGITVHVLLGADAPNLEAVNLLADGLPYEMIVRSGIDTVSELLSDMDLAIGAPGSSTWERCCLGLPTVTLTIADNQRDIARILSAQGASLDGGGLSEFDPDAFAALLEGGVLRNVEVRRDLSLEARNVCDGKGARRVADALRLNLVKAGREHVRVMHEWQSHPDTRRFARDTAPPSWDNHVAWCDRRLLRDPLDFYIAMRDGIPLGLVRLDPNSERGLDEISIIVAPDAHGQGLGTWCLRQIALRYPDRDILAHVDPRNRASWRIFEKCGYVMVDDSHLVYRADQDMMEAG